MRKLPKRVIKREDGRFYPQVWFLWWHYVWTDYYFSWVAESFRNMDDAIHFLGSACETFSEPKSVTVVWSDKGGEE